MLAVAPEEMIEKYSMAFSGFSDQGVSGKIFRNGILPIRPVIEDFKNGREGKSLQKSWPLLLKTWRLAARSHWKNASLTEPSLPLKKGVSGGKNETWKGNKDHGDR